MNHTNEHLKLIRHCFYLQCRSLYLLLKYWIGSVYTINQYVRIFHKKKYYTLILLIFVMIIFLSGCCLFKKEKPISISKSVNDKQLQVASGSVNTTNEFLNESKIEEAKISLQPARQILPDMNKDTVKEWFEIKQSIVTGDVKQINDLKNNLTKLQAESQANEQKRQDEEIRRNKSLNIMSWVCNIVGGLIVVLSFVFSRLQHNIISLLGVFIALPLFGFGYFMTMIPDWLFLVLAICYSLIIPFCMLYAYRKGLFTPTPNQHD